MGQDLPKNSYAVLGLLSFGDKSGYELKQFADDSIRHFFWAPAKSQFYSVLKKLRLDGYLSERDVAQESAPDKRVYSLTKQGREVLGDWLENSPAGMDVLKSPVMLRAFFGLEMSPSALIGQLESYRVEAVREQQQLAHWMESRDDSDSGFFKGLTIKFGMGYKTAAIEWADEAIRDIEERFGVGGAE
jgi:DNA-binding PadR family transcriptional regulator